MFREGSRCCTIEDVNRARRVCDRLDIRHYTLNVLDAFEERVIRPFVDEYAHGRTPNPCILCNRHFKFGVLLDHARDLGCAALATGHYARLEPRPGGFRIRRGVDPRKDQSYFLHRLTQAQLAAIRFPLGGLTKPEVRAHAARLDLPVAGAPETVDLCFLTPAGPAPFVERYRPELRREGPVVDASGRVLGTHHGVHQFTIGQREGLGIAAATRLYVTRLDPETNTVTVGPRDAALARECAVDEVFWQTPDPPGDGETVEVKVRYQTPAVSARLRHAETDSVRLEFEAPVFALTPGQAAVFYRGDEILGGGWIR
jgi:tRNA-specific 2-thiouridylase